MLFAVIIGLATNGWAQTTVYVDGAGTDTGDGTQSSPYKTISEAIQKAQGGEIIQIKGGTYVEADLTVTKPLSFIGVTTSNVETIIKGNIIVSAKANDDVSFKNLTLENESKTYSDPTKPTPIILMQRGGAILTLDNCIVNNNATGWGNGYGEGVYKKMAISIQSDSTAVGGIVVKNTTINMNGNNQTGISCNGEVSKLTLEKSKINDIGHHTGCFGVDVHCQGMEVIIDNSEIKLGKNYYALYVLGLNQTIYVRNQSVIQGWSAIYANVESSNSTIYVNDSKLIGYSEMTGSSNSFSTISIQAVKNVRVVVTNSEIQTRIKDVDIAPMTPITFSLNTYIDDSWADKCIVELRGNTKVSHTLQNGAERFIEDESDRWNRVLADPTVELKYYDAANQSEIDAIKIWGQGDTLRTAVNTLETALKSVIAVDRISLPGGTYNGFNVDKKNVTIEGVAGKTFIKGQKKYTGGSVACIAADNVTIKNLSFQGELSDGVRPTGLFLGGGTITVDNCLFDDKNLNTGIYSEPGSTTGKLLIQNCKFNVYDKNLLLSAGRENATVKNNIFVDSDISVAKNDGTNVVEQNEFHNCVVKVQDGVKFTKNKMYPGSQQYLYSVRPDNFTGVVNLSNNYWGSSNPDFSQLIEYSRSPLASVNVYPYYQDEALQTMMSPSVQNGKITITADATDFVANGKKLQEMINYAATQTPIPEIILEAGTYTGNFVMKEGVNVTGTFASGDSTILDGGAVGRVVSQGDLFAKYTGNWQTTYAFSKETVWKNLIIQNGKITNETKEKYGAAAGAYISKNGVLSNCVIRNNVTEGSDIKAGGVLLDSGGKLENCTIENNKACDSYAGVMILADGVVRNCVIRYNQVTSTEHTAGVGSRNAGASSIVSVTNASVLIEGCDIYQNYTNGASGGAAGVNLNNTVGHVEIRNSKIHDNGDLKTDSRAGLATGYAEIQNSINIINCLVYNNGKASTAVNKSMNGIIAASGTNILNCTVWDNAGEHSGIYAIESGNPVITTTNTIAQDYYGKLSSDESVTSSRHLITYSLIPTVREGITFSENANNLIGEVNMKMFADSTKGNYSPVFGAPYVDKGIIGSWTADDKDLAGVSRIQGSNIDMGAYESSLSADAKPVKITSVPNTITFGDTIRLLSNYKNVKYEFAENKDGVLGWYKNGADDKDISIVALKPGSATLKVSTTTTETSNVSSLLVVTVEKKTISVNTACLSVKDTTYGCTYDGVVTIATEVSSDASKLFNGLVKDHASVSLSDLKGSISSTNAGQQVPVSVTATLSGTDASYYTLAPINNITMKIGRKKLTVTAEDKTRIYGDENPAFTVKYNGFISEEDAKVLGGELKYACAANKESLTGDYKISPYGYTSSNYEIEYVDATLKVASIDPKVELVSAVIDPESKDKVILKGRLIHTGGAVKDTKVKVGFTQGETAISSTPEEMTEAGEFTVTTGVLGNATYEYKATAQIDGGTLVTSASQSVTINKEYAVQTVQFAGLSDKIEYGTAPITLSATSNQETATGDYTYKVESGDVVKIEGKTLTILKAGTATISVSRPVDDANRCTAASALRTIEVTKKPVRIVNKSTITKTYDNTLDASVSLSELKIVDAAGEAVTGVSLTGTVTGKYADKNVGNGKKIVISGAELSDNANYELLGYNVTGNITQANLSISIVDAKRRYNETRPTYTLVYSGFQGSDNENTPGIHTGTIGVVEKANNVLSVSTEGVSFPNYSLRTNDATVTIEKGTPKVVTYSDASGVYGKIVDAAGWKVTLGNVTDNRACATYTDDSGNMQTVYGAQLSGAGTVEVFRDGNVMTRALEAEFKTYGQRMKIKFTSGASIESTDPSILKIIEIGDETATIEAVGIGHAAIVAIASDNMGANLLEAEIKPLEIGVKIDGTVAKVYDGTTAAEAVSLNTTGIYTGDDVSLSYGAFTYSNKNVGKEISLLPSRTIELVGTKAANYEIGTIELKGAITERKLDVKSVTKEYNGKTSDEAITTYQADGLVEGDVVPLKVNWSTNVEAGTYDSGITVSLPTGTNYTLPDATPAPTITGTITQAKIVATIGTLVVSSETESAFKVALKQSGSFKLAATDETFSIQSLSDYNPTITFAGGKYTVTGGDTKNYTFVYANNEGSYSIKSSGGGSPIVSVNSVSLDKSELTLPRMDSYTLKATINPDDATNQKVSWKSSDETVAKVDANGKVTALKVGTATITVTTEDGGKTATCVVTVDFATGLEEAIANTTMYGKNGQIVIEPLAPMPVMIVNMTGTVVYNGRISGTTYVPVATGIYIVKLGTGNDAHIRKVNVR